jgi:tetratricopeptide (TPR) repeat protein
MATKNKLKKEQVKDPIKIESSLNSGFERKVIISLSLIIGLIAVLLYANTFTHEYVLDDHDIIRLNTHVQKGIDGIPTIMSTTIRNGAGFHDDYLYRPLSQAMFALEWEIWPNNPHPSHIINVLLYALTCSFLFLMLKRWTGNVNISFIAALLFAFHPIHTEVVANIKSRDEILSMLGIVLALYHYHSYLLSGKFKYLIYTSLMTGVAMFSKESSIIIILILPLFVYFLSETKQNTENTNYSFITKTITKVNPYKGLVSVMGVILLFLLIRSQIVEGLGAEDVAIADNFLFATDDVLERKATAFFLMGYMIRILALPHPLAIDYGYNDFDIMTLSDSIVWLSIATYLFIGTVILKGLKQKSIISFILLFFLISIALPSNLFKEIGTAFGERLLYQPSLAFCLLVAYFLSRYFIKKDQSEPSNLASFFKNLGLTSVLLIVLGGAYSFKTVARNAEWKNELSLFGKDVITRPNSAHMTFYYGNHLTNEDFLKSCSPADSAKYIHEGIFYLKRSTEILDLFPVAHNQLGYTYYKIAKRNHLLAYVQGNDQKGLFAMRDKYMDSAYISIRKAVSISKKHTFYNTYASWMFDKSNHTGNLVYLDTALIFLNKAVELYPGYVEGWNNMGSVYGQQKRFDEAIQAFDKALEISPNDETANKFKNLTIELKSKNQNDPYLLGLQLIDEKKFDQAAIQFEIAIKNNPNSAELYTRLAWCYGETKRFQETIDVLNKALDIDPRYARAYLFLGVTYEQLGNKVLASQNLSKACQLDPSLCK